MPIEFISSSYNNVEGTLKWLKQSESVKRLTRHTSPACSMEIVVEWVRRKQLIGATNWKGLTDLDN